MVNWKFHFDSFESFGFCVSCLFPWFDFFCLFCYLFLSFVINLTNSILVSSAFTWFQVLLLLLAFTTVIVILECFVSLYCFNILGSMSKYCVSPWIVNCFHILSTTHTYFGCLPSLKRVLNASVTISPFLLFKGFIHPYLLNSSITISRYLYPHSIHWIVAFQQGLYSVFHQRDSQ